nr:putative reverse transcriptase domain-containing protein [Tanacetum cinerariifolium]
MLRACVLEFGRSWDVHVLLVKFSYDNSYHSSVRCAPFEALYGRKCRSPIMWAEVEEGHLMGPDYADKRRKPLEFSVGDYVLLKVLPWKGVVRFGKKRKLAPRFVGPFEIIEKVGTVAYRLDFPKELNEEPVEILDREFKKLKQSRISIVKIRWNSKCGPEFTLEREDQMKLKYPHLFSDINDLDGYDSDCDDFSIAKAVLMANLSSYGSDVLSKMEAAVQQYFIDKQCFEIQMKQFLIENDRLLDQIISQDIVNILVNSSVNMNTFLNVHSSVVMNDSVNYVKNCNKYLKLKAELIKQHNMVEKDEYNKLSKSFSKLEQHCISLELSMQLNKENFQKNNTSVNQTEPQFDQLFKLTNLKAKLQAKDTTIKKLKANIKRLNKTSTTNSVKKDIDEIETINIELEHREKVFVITALKNNLRKFKGKDVVDNAAQVSNATTIAPGMYKLDPITLAPTDKNNRVTHIYYLKHTMEQVSILREIVKQAKSLNPLDSASYSACKHELCFLEFAFDMNVSSKSKSVKKAKRKKNGNLQEKITATNKVPLREPIPLEVVAQESVVTKVYNRRPKVPKTNGSSSKPKIAKSMISNKMEPNTSRGSNTSVDPSSCSIIDLSTIKFGNDQIAKIMGYGDYQIGNIIILRVYYVEGLGHNLFSIGQFCDSDLVVAFKKHTCFVHNLEASKDKALDFRIKFLKMIQVRLKAPVKNIRIDNGTEFVNQTLRSHYESVDTPMVEKNKLDEDLQGTPVDATLYRCMIGSLMYLTSGRPDLIYAVYLCARYQDTRCSTSGNVHFLGDKLARWSSKKQKSTAISSTKVENGIVEIYFVLTEYQLPNIFTKPLKRERFNFLIEKLGMRSMSLEMLKRLKEEEDK